MINDNNNSKISKDKNIIEEEKKEEIEIIHSSEGNPKNTSSLNKNSGLIFLDKSPANSVSSNLKKHSLKISS